MVVVIGSQWLDAEDSNGRRRLDLETDFNSLTLGPGRLNHSGEVVYHGPFFGMVYAR